MRWRSRPHRRDSAFASAHMGLLAAQMVAMAAMAAMAAQRGLAADVATAVAAAAAGATATAAGAAKAGAHGCCSLSRPCTCAGRFWSATSSRRRPGRSRAPRRRTASRRRMRPRTREGTWRDMACRGVPDQWPCRRGPDSSRWSRRTPTTDRAPGPEAMARTCTCRTPNRRRTCQAPPIGGTSSRPALQSQCVCE